MVTRAGRCARYELLLLILLVLLLLLLGAALGKEAKGLPELLALLVLLELLGLLPLLTDALLKLGRAKLLLEALLVVLLQPLLELRLVLLV